MREGWVASTLGEIASIRGSKTDPALVDPDCPYVGLEHVSSGESRVHETGRAGDMSSLVSEFEEGDTLFGRLRPYLRKVALADFRGVCTSEILVLQPNAALVMPAFLHLLASCESTIETCVDKSAGSRMPRTSAGDLLAVNISLPPLSEQRRIVDLVAAVDANIKAAVDLMHTVSRVRAGLVSEWVDAHTTQRQSVGSLASLGSGPSWKATSERTTAESGALRVLGITNTPAQRTITMDNETYVHDLPEKTTLLGPASLLMIRTNGNRSRIGNVYRVPAVAVGCAYSAFQIGLHFESVANADFAYWMLSDERVQASISANASGTTGLGNVAVGWLKNLELPWPADESIRSEAVALFDAADELVANAAAAADSLRAARAALLADLLSGNHEIPESYDELLEDVA